MHGLFKKKGLNFAMIGALDSDVDGFANIPGDAKDFPGRSSAGKTTTGINAHHNWINCNIS